MAVTSERRNFSGLRGKRRGMPPDDTGRRKNGSAPSRAIWVQVENFAALKCRNIPGGEKNIARVAMAAGEFSRGTFGGAGIRHLKLRKAFLAWHAGFKNESGFCRNNDLAQAQPWRRDLG